MLTVTVWKLHVTVQASSHLNFLQYIRSVAAGLLQNYKVYVLSPKPKKNVNNGIGPYHPINLEYQGRCTNYKNNVKNIKNAVFAYILCALLTTTSDKIMFANGVFFIVFCSLEILQ